MTIATEAAHPSTEHVVDRRLRPLHGAVFLQALVIWFAAEKLFLSEIGFTPAAIGLMAAVYAGVVPLVEFPSGILADRWSRRGVFAVACASMAACSLVGGLSNGIGLYLVSAVLLGITLALQSGTVDSMVYDLLVEQTGDGSDFIRRIGRVRLLEGLGLTAGALLGGLLSEAASPRMTYFATIPPVLVALALAFVFREPRLHRSEQRLSLGEQLSVTVRTIADRGAVVPVLLLGAVAGVAVQLVFEFGPLWLVALAVPAVLFGPHWAALTGTLALGGVLATLIPWHRTAALVVLGVVMTGASAATAVSHSLAALVAAQVVLLLALVTVGIHASQRLHDAIPSHVRAGVASGAGTVVWLSFVPVALVFGWVAEALGVHRAGWLLTGLVAASAVILLRIAVAPPADTHPDEGLSCAEVVALATAYADDEMPAGTAAAVGAHRHFCPGCDRYVGQVRELLRGLASLR
ncbi:MAG: MFS transporter [Actinomycetota bacterium]|nr:MFS transporter [Actinomycetota bacterium]